MRQLHQICFQFSSAVSTIIQIFVTFITNSNLDVIKLVMVRYLTFFHLLLLQRKEEREFAIFGGAAPDSAAVTDEPDDDLDDEEENEPNATVSGIP